MSQPTPLLAFHLGVADHLHRNLNLRLNTGLGQLKLLNKPAPSGFEETHLYFGLSLESDLLRACIVEAGIQQRLLIPYFGALKGADLFFALWFQI